MLLRPIAVLTFLLAGPSLIIGCGVYRNLKQATRKLSLGANPSPSRLNKKVVLGRFVNLSRFDQEGFASIVQRVFTETLAENCPDTLLLVPQDTDYPTFMANPPRLRSGKLDNATLAAMGRSEGINVIVLGEIFDIREYQEKRGILWFKDTRSFIQFQLNVAALDTETGAKIMQETVSDEIAVDETQYDAIQQQGIVERTELEGALSTAAEELGSMACRAVAQIEWKAFVGYVGDSIRLSAGKQSGIRVGDVFTVHDITQTLDGVGNERFIVPGKRIGQIEVTVVGPETSEAVAISGNTIPPGSAVRLAR
jgi:hypothetical protein